MHIILRYPSGRLADAILLAAGAGRMRFIERRRNETMEVFLKQGHWTFENGVRVEIEGLFAGDQTGVADFCSALSYRTSTATH